MEEPLAPSASRYLATSFALVPHGPDFAVYRAYGARRDFVAVISPAELASFFALSFDQQKAARAREDARIASRVSAQTAAENLDIDLEL